MCVDGSTIPKTEAGDIVTLPIAHAKVLQEKGAVVILSESIPITTPAPEPLETKPESSPEHIPSWGWIDLTHHTLMLRENIETKQKRQDPICRDYTRTDLGNSQRLVRRYGAVLRYCHAFSSWFFWDGRRWSRDDQGFVIELAKDTANRIADEAAISDGQDREGLYKWCGTSQARARIDNLISLAESSLPISPADMDKPPHLLNVRNGTLDLSSFILQDHRQGDMLTKMANVEYKPDTDCPQWREHLQLIFDGDVELIAGFQMMCGYSLLANNPEQVLFILYGTGKNGKTVTLDVLSSIFGDYAVNIASESLMARKNSDSPRGDIARTAGGRLITASEGEDGARLAESLVKQLTGGDRVTVRRLYESEFEFIPTGKIWLSTNHKPIVTGTDSAIWRRIWLVPFMVTISEERRDHFIVERLLT
jgi:putative DNA primase/helicase